MEDQAIRTKRDDDGLRLGIVAALSRRHDTFALSYLSWTAEGYIVKFRLGVVDVVRTAVGPHVVEDSSRIPPTRPYLGRAGGWCALHGLR